MYRLCYLLSKKHVFRLLIDCIINLAAFILSLPFVALLIALHCAHFLLKWIILAVYDRSPDSQFAGTGKKILKGDECGWLEKCSQDSVLQAVLVFDSKINVNRIQELITSRVIPMYPRLTHKICPLPFMAGTVQCWLPDNNYDINRHVFTDHVNLSDGQLQKYVSKLTNKRLPTDKPPWELRVLSQSVDCSATDTIVILRVHHSLADGMMLIKILCTKLADTRASYTAFKNHFKFSYYLRLVQAICIGPALVLHKLITAYKRNKGLFRNRQEEKNCTINWSTSISMCKVERIRQVTRSSYNCVFVSAVTGGLRYVLQSSGIKHPPDLKITFPFVTGKSQKFIPISTFIPVSMEGAIPRLWQTKHRLKLLNSSLDLLITSFVIHVLMPICPSFYIPRLNEFLHKSVNVQFSSIVGPTTRLVIDGSPLKTIYPLSPCQSDLGISVAVSTYVDQFYVTVSTHNSLDNIGKILICFIEEQLDRMYSLLVNRTIPEEVGDDYIQSQLPDVSELPIKELKSRMQAIQHELQRLSELLSYNEDDVKRFSHFKSEFSHIFKELRRRKSVKIRRPSILAQTIENVSSICSSRKSVSVILYPFKNELFCKDTVCTFCENNISKTTDDDNSFTTTATTTTSVTISNDNNNNINNNDNHYHHNHHHHYYHHNINGNRLKFKQINFEEAMQMIFYKKCPSRPSFKGCSYTNTNKYIYLTLMNANVNLENGSNRIGEIVVDEDTPLANRNYASEISADGNLSHEITFYDLGENEHII